MILYVAGQVPEDRMIAVTGTTGPSSAERQAARTLGGLIARRGCTLVCGLARGVDTEAALGALDAGGHVVGALPFALSDTFYPPESEALAARILDARGGLVSTYASGQAERWRFVERDIVIAGLATMTIAASAADPITSRGTGWTVRFAKELGRPTYRYDGTFHGNPRVSGEHDTRRYRTAIQAWRDGDVFRVPMDRPSLAI